MSRATVTKIQVWVDGKGPINIDPDDTAAIFFTDHAVKDILAPFYAGGGAGAGFGVDPITVWNTTTASGKEPAYLIKIPQCGIIPG
jgi:hypothetical protein